MIDFFCMLSLARSPILNCFRLCLLNDSNCTLAGVRWTFGRSFFDVSRLDEGEQLEEGRSGRTRPGKITADCCC